jgi:hypothetical protein
VTKRKYYAFDAILMTAGAVAALMLALFMLMPGLDHGMAFGMGGFALTAAMIVVSVAVSSTFWGLAFRKDRWKLKDMRNFAAVVLPTAFVFFYGTFNMAQSDFELGEYLQQNKIEHFCLNNFRREDCVTAVNLCPKCALRIDKWKRNKMVANLNAYAQYFPKEHAKRQPANVAKTR